MWLLASVTIFKDYARRTMATDSTVTGFMVPEKGGGCSRKLLRLRGWDTKTRLLGSKEGLTEEALCNDQLKEGLESTFLFFLKIKNNLSAHSLASSANDKDSSTVSLS